MIDPFKSFETIIKNYKSYIKTAFSTRFPSFERERDELLNTDGVLYRQPWVEMLPEYKSSGKKVGELTCADTGLDLESLQWFQELVITGLFPANIELYEHQVKMLRKSMVDNQNCIITSGTGSGKTESFLLPLFAQLSKEAHKWNGAFKPTEQDVLAKQLNWWRKTASGGVNINKTINYQTGKFKSECLHRGHESRPQGVRALILYPMNALVEDQMTRLRTALDSDESRSFFDGEFDSNEQRKWLKNRIYFGRYNGATPTPGIFPQYSTGASDEEKLTKKRKARLLLQRLRGKLREIDENNAKVDSYLQNNPDVPGNKSSDKKYFFQRLDGAEMRTRFDMQETPPDILITNFSMMSIMLMREADRAIFQKTKEWLAADKGNIFHLIIDELHLYRGTQGTEVAFLIRMLLQRLDLNPESSQLRILASSASLEPGDPKSLKFLKDFFGVPFLEEQIITGQSEEVIEQVKEPFNLEDLAQITKNYDSASHDISDQSFLDSCSAFAGEAGTGIDGAILKLHQAGFRKSIMEVFSAASSMEIYNHTNNSQTFAGNLFGPAHPPELLYLAVRGLLILRGLKDARDIDNPEVKKIKLPRLRFHYFIRNIEGIWANADIATVAPDFLDETGLPDELKRTVGRLHARADIADESGNRLFDVLYCENCGTTFLGGSRLNVNDKLEMIAVSPDIEGIPENSPQSLVEKRKYRDYLVFWPQGSQQASADIAYTRHGNSGSWRQYYLNKQTGDLDQEIDGKGGYTSGLLFLLNDDTAGLANEERALPCTCPACASSYVKGRSRTSPLRGFRSGFGKTAQILSKELFYQLPDQADRRKLVLFSDSREDAAKLANNIEREHFTDMVREALISVLYNHPGLNKKSIALELNKNGSNGIVSPDVIEHLKATFDTKSVNEVYDVYFNMFNSPIEDKRHQFNADWRVLLSQIPSVNFRLLAATGVPSVLERLYLTGVNPRGLSIRAQEFTNNSMDWFKIFEKANDTIRLAGSVDQNNETIRDTIYQAGKALFGRLYFGLEASGLAFIGVDSELSGQIPITEIDKYYAYIRKLGDNYYYEDNDYDVTGINGNWSAKVKSLIIAHQDNPMDVYDHLRHWNIITTEGLLRYEALALYPILNPQQTYYECTNCFRPHLHSSGYICTFCNKRLNLSDKKVEQLRFKNHLAVHAIIEKRKAVRLHCEEMTGQTDNQFKRQRHFRNMVLEDEGPADIRIIDLLSVTTTLEVGVDIGSLQAVILGNMPPQRFNYQQRVGRAGRRGQAFAAILTFCRGRSHDEHYFNNPKEITSDPPPTPVLSMDQVRILRRVFNKFIISSAFREAGLARDGLSRSTHGEMGSFQDWDQNKQLLSNWLNVNNDNLEGFFKKLSFGTNIKWADLNKDNYYKDIFFTTVDHMMTNHDLPGEEVADRLAEGGILPMFGMPTSVKNLYHGFDEDAKTMKSIDRDQAMAIGEFAPGSEKTKDKRIYKSIGITPELDYKEKSRYAELMKPDQRAFRYGGHMIKCPNCRLIRTAVYEGSAADPLNEELGKPEEIACPECAWPMAERFPMIIPVAYRTDFKSGRDTTENNEMVISRPPIYAEPDSKDGPAPLVENLDNAVASISEADTTWRINKNGDQFFNFKKYELRRTYRGRDITVGGQWFLDEGRTPSIAGATVEPQQISVTTALAANKTTEVLRISPSATVSGVLFDMFDIRSLQASGVKGAVYSAAFLLQRAIAIALDVDPLEIEIAEIVKDPNGLPVITLTDELPNGSGFVRFGFSNLQALIKNRILGGAVEKSNAYFEYIQGDVHQECLSSCYKCLKIYRNMSYHALLDWRLGMSWLRFLTEPLYKFGTDGNFDFTELKDWPKTGKKVARDLSAAFGDGNVQTSPGGKLFGFLAKGTPVIVIHPLWNPAEIQEEWLAAEMAGLEERLRSGGSKRKLQTVDTFNGLRRPAKCKTW